MAKAAKRTEAKSDTSIFHPTDMYGGQTLCAESGKSSVVYLTVYGHVLACVVFITDTSMGTHTHTHPKQKKIWAPNLKCEEHVVCLFNFMFPVGTLDTS